MTDISRPDRILIVTGMSGAGKSTAMNTLEDLGWEAVENLPLGLLDRLLGTPAAAGAGDHDRPLVLGIDSRTRGFDARGIVVRLASLRQRHGRDIAMLFLDCATAELERRFSETRRRHPLALDRPAIDGIIRERELLDPLRQSAEHLIDTTDLTSNGLQQIVRARFGDRLSRSPSISVMSFGYARGLPRNADLVFDMRFLSNPHWDPVLRPGTGLDPAVIEHIARDEAYDDIIPRIEELILALLPRYAAEGKSYVTIAFGCTGGKHRSVHVAERIASRLRGAGISPSVSHRDIPPGAADVAER